MTKAYGGWCSTFRASLGALGSGFWICAGRKPMTWYPKWPIEIRPLATDLHLIMATNPDAKPVRGIVNPGTLYSYFRKHRSGNVLFHGPDFKRFYKEHRAFVDDHGGIAHRVLTHGPEGSPNHTILTEFWDTRHRLPATDASYQPPKMSVIEFDHVPSAGRWLTGIKPIPLPAYAWIHRLCHQERWEDPTSERRLHLHGCNGKQTLARAGSTSPVD